MTRPTHLRALPIKSGGQEVRMHKGYYARALLVRLVRALKAVLLENSLYVPYALTCPTRPTRLNFL